MLLANAVHTLLLREQSPMPITRRRRANPPDEPENNNHVGEQTENAAEALKTEQPLTGQVEGETGTGAPVTDYTVTPRSEEHTSELQSPCNLVCRLLLEKKNR